MTEVMNWIKENWDQICDVIEKMFDILMKKIG